MAGSTSNDKRRKTNLLPNFHIHHNRPILNLPKEILIAILCTLPPKTIIACKRVCKALYDIIISDPYFAEAHYKYTTTTDPVILRLVINPNRFNDGPYVPDSVYLVEGYDNDNHDYQLAVSSKLMNNPSSLTNGRRFTIVNSCRGFLYLRTQLGFDNEFFVYNPLTQKHFILPPVKADLCAMQEICMMGLGFGPITKQYKAVRLIKTMGAYDLRVYTVGVDSGWRPVDIPIDLIEREFRPMDELTVLDGILHCSMSQRSYQEEIVCFDVDKEKVSTIALPESLLKKHPDRSICVLSIFDIYGLLGAGIRVLGSFRTEIWIMKEYGVKDSWVKYFSLRDGIQLIGRSPSLIEVRRNRDKILLCEEDMQSHFFMSYNYKEKTPTRLKISGFDNGKRGATAISYVPTFFTIATSAQ